MPMSSMIDGIATFTMVLSTMIKDTPRLMKNSPIQRLLSMLSNIAPADRYARRVGTPEFEDWSLGRLLSTAARLVEHDWNSWLASHELTHAALLALHALRHGPLTQRQLAAANRVEEQTMSRALNLPYAACATNLLRRAHPLKCSRPSRNGWVRAPVSQRPSAAVWWRQHAGSCSMS